MFSEIGEAPTYKAKDQQTTREGSLANEYTERIAMFMTQGMQCEEDN